MSGAVRPAGAGWPAGAWVAAFVLYLGVAGVARDAYFLPADTSAAARLAACAHSMLAPALWAGVLMVVLHVTRSAGAPGRGAVPRTLALAAGLTAAQTLVEAGAGYVAPQVGAHSITNSFTRAVIVFPTSLLVTLGLLAAGYAVAQASRRSEQEERGARLAADLSRARMQGLESQLRPHFLFNVLQSVATLMHRDVPAARAMLVRLRVLLERSLAAERGGQTTLREELALLRLYTDIEAVRFGDRLRVEVEMEGDAEDAAVPVLLLQPLVENAIRHAVEVRGEGTVRIHARRDGPGQPLHLRISDPGAPAPDPLPHAPSGIGLSNTRSRLELLYGDEYELGMERSPSAGTVVHLRLPAPVDPEDGRAWTS
jgi:LytS/YehU family sensor histidine kinase